MMPSCAVLLTTTALLPTRVPLMPAIKSLGLSSLFSNANRVRLGSCACVPDINVVAPGGLINTALKSDADIALAGGVVAELLHPQRRVSDAGCAADQSV